VWCVWVEKVGVPRVVGGMEGEGEDDRLESGVEEFWYARSRWW
jgi:hypothetical protein